jgi:uncharacterized metal-binding protein YceD (DUF177 family)
MATLPPLSSIYDLTDVSDAGAEIVVAANAGQRAKLAEWAGVDAVERFEGTVTLKRLSGTRFAYEALLDADVVQSCVVTLEPVRAQIERTVSRVLQLARKDTARKRDQEVIDLGGAEEVEEIESPFYDLAGPLLEEFVLAINPYPRAAGVAFQSPAVEERTESPFAVLRGLKAGK